MKDEMETLLTVKEYATLFRRHPQTIYDAIKRNRLPYPLERPSGSDRVFIRVPRELVEKLRAA